MIKKILLWSLYAAFIGLIIFGAIYRTTAKLEEGSPAREASQSQTEGGNRNQSGSGGNRSSSSEHEQEEIESQAYPSPTEDSLIISSSDTIAEHTESETGHDWLTLTGIVTEVTTKSLTLTLDDGQNLVIERRPWRFAQESGFITSIGNQLELSGFYENDEFQAAQITDLTTGTWVQLRDDTGHPLWASG